MSADTLASCARTSGTPGDTHMYSDVVAQLSTCRVMAPVVKLLVLTLHCGLALSQLAGVLLTNWLHAVLLPAMKPVYALSQACTWMPYLAASGSATHSGSRGGR